MIGAAAARGPAGAAAAPRRLAVTGGRVLDAAAPRGRLAEILIEGDTILDIVPAGTPLDPSFTEVDGRDRAIIPGLVNAHTHGHGGLSKGSGDRWTLELLLNAGGWLGGARDDADRYLSTLLTAVELLKKGCTACFDLALAVPLPTRSGLAAVGQAYQDAGIRAVVAPMIGDIHFYRAMPGLFASAPPDLQRDMERAASSDGDAVLSALAEIAAGWPFADDRVRLGLAPTIPLHCTDAFLVGCDRIAREHGLVLQTHLAESPAQAVASAERFGMSITAHLDRLGLLGRHFSGAHGVWLDEADMALLAARGAAISHNPGSNLRLGSGMADARALLQEGVRLGIGTDGGASADGQNMFEATRLACNLSRVRGRPPEDWLSAPESIELASAGGADVLGFGGLIGRIAPGFKADLVFLDLRHIDFVPLNDLANQIVHVEDGGAVRRVMVGGDTVVEDGRVLTVDFDRLVDDAAAAADRLAEANRETRAAAERLAPYVSRFCHGLACRCPKGVNQLECST